MSIRNLQHLLNPRSVALIGASGQPDTIGQVVLANILRGGYEGSIYAVNPKSYDVTGAKWFTSIAALPEPPDLAVIMTPAPTIPLIIRELGAKGTKAAVIISAASSNHTDLHLPMINAASPYLMRLVGPNCLGLIMPHAKLQASFAATSAKPGGLAFLSQSGALVTAMLDWALHRNLGFSGIVSVGDMADVDIGDLVDLFAADPKTDAILIYIEGIAHAAKFMSAARAAVRIKPVIAIKAGRSAGVNKAVMSHTGAMAGLYDVYEAAFQRAGIVMVETLAELFDAAEVLGKRHTLAGNRLGIITNGGGAGILGADALSKTDGALAHLSAETITSLDAALPTAWSHGNPVDVIGDADESRYSTAIKAVAGDAGVDALLVMNCPTAIVHATKIADAIAATVRELRAKGCSKPVLACWLGDSNRETAQPVFASANIPLFDTPTDAVRGFAYLLAAKQAREALMATPTVDQTIAGNKQNALNIIDQVRHERRTVLNEMEAKALLAAYGIPVVDTRLAPTADAITQACVDLSAPYVVKIVSPDITHKSDVGGVALNLADVGAAIAAAKAMHDHIRRELPHAKIKGFAVESMCIRPHAHELIVGVMDDPTFGPTLMIGAGGKAVEVLHDRALGLPPLTGDMARAMIERTRISHLLGGYRDEPAADVSGIVEVLDAVSALAVDLPDIVELDINPLLVDPTGVVALDARVRITAEPNPKSRLVIRPAPHGWASDLETRSGLKFHVRPVRPDDEAALVVFFSHVTPDDLRFRFFTGLRAVSHELLAMMTQVDYQRTITFLAISEDGKTVIATAMLAADPDHKRAELALCTRGDMKKRGVSWSLLEYVLKYAKADGISTVESIESADHAEALQMEREMSFVSRPAPDDASVRIVSKSL